MMELKERILQLHQDGLSYRDIESQLGCSKGTIAYHLGIGVKDRQAARQRDRRRKLVRYIQEYKSGKVCADCLEDYPYWMMDFDHLSDKKFNLSSCSKHTTSLAVIITEMAKCDVVCANCHRNRTFNRMLKTGESIVLR
jgi:hypothetical protein